VFFLIGIQKNSVSLNREKYRNRFSLILELILFFNQAGTVTAIFICICIKRRRKSKEKKKSFSHSLSFFDFQSFFSYLKKDQDLIQTQNAYNARRAETNVANNSQQTACFQNQPFYPPQPPPPYLNDHLQNIGMHPWKDVSTNESKNVTNDHVVQQGFSQM
jgi:hypothetical protein